MEENKLALCIYRRLRLVQQYKQAHLFIYQTVKGLSDSTEIPL